jgi:hypothetical protein
MRLFVAEGSNHRPAPKTHCPPRQARHGACLVKQWLASRHRRARFIKISLILRCNVSPTPRRPGKRARRVVLCKSRLCRSAGAILADVCFEADVRKRLPANRYEQLAPGAYRSPDRVLTFHAPRSTNGFLISSAKLIRRAQEILSWREVLLWIPG